MREFVISTESNADLSKEYAAANEICVIPHYYKIDEKVYGEEEELTTKEFYDEMRAKKIASTMASNPGVIKERFTAYAQAGKDILHISFSSALSGGCSNVMMMAGEVMEEFPEMKIVVLDTLSASVGEALMIQKALDLKRAGAGLEDAVAAVKALIPHLCVQFTVDDLNHLYRGGRLSRASAMLGTIVNIKPILYIDEAGKLLALDKVRGRKKAIAALVDKMEERVGSFRDKQIAIGIVHGDCEEEALYLKNLIADRFGYSEFRIQPIGPSIGAHSGPGALGVIYLGDHR